MKRKMMSNSSFKKSSTMQKERQGGKAVRKCKEDRQKGNARRKGSKEMQGRQVVR